MKIPICAGHSARHRRLSEIRVPPGSLGPGSGPPVLGAPGRADWKGAALAAIGTLTLAACGEPPRQAPESIVEEWRLVWSDEFDGETIDRSNWQPELMPDPYNEELQYYTDRIDAATGANAWQQDGLLVIEARREDYAHRRYTSARLISQDLQEFRYGRFEARIKQPGEIGMWPAFWLLGSTIDEAGWPRCGEIDILEGKGRLAQWTSGAIHYGPDPEGHEFQHFEYELEDGSFHDEWHEFAVEWEPGRIRWFAAGRLMKELEKPEGADPARWPFDDGHPFFLILNLAVGGWFDEPHQPPEEMDPQRLLVDWVRVYERG